MRVLGIETSTRRGSVAALDGENTLGTLAHEEPSAHAERVLALVECLLGEVGWSRSSIDRVAVGIGPGSFTGLRVGIALAQGMALGLGRPIVGVGSLAALAAAVPRSEKRTRIPVLDARRGELFVAGYTADGVERLAPAAVPVADVPKLLADLFAPGELVLVGEAARLAGGGYDVIAGGELDLPHAVPVARLGLELDPAAAPAEPTYVRGPGATPQNLPPSPLA
ncbi:MAG TPA: tRNA (adenosine(37)-N6)-threonylcarbamoyltransferase complex dimerization subunit type 1 TsaB [Polyangiaceae bacterium]|nr:tRNA (adenosine(37)-N6)-threonylcarbamoyltransferase complex dimerization subunit type 1 TsaB [Polyangiaceae bacterium]